MFLAPRPELAAWVKLSTSHFIRQFKLAPGLASPQYFNLCLGERAKELLAQAVTTVAEEAHQVGFFDQSHLARHFKTWVGVVPKQYRDNLTT